MLSEELFFCQAARKLGIEIFVVPNAVTSHIGSFSYLMNLPAVASLNPVLEQPVKEAA